MGNLGFSRVYVKFLIGEIGFEDLKSMMHCVNTFSSVGGDANDAGIVKRKIKMIRFWIFGEFIICVSCYHLRLRVCIPYMFVE